jgi:hypothetical protein
MSSRPSDYLIDNLGDFSGVSHVNSGVVPSNFARSFLSEFLFRHSNSIESIPVSFGNAQLVHLSVSSFVRPFSAANSTVLIVDVGKSETSLDMMYLLQTSAHAVSIKVLYYGKYNNNTFT